MKSAAVTKGNQLGASRAPKEENPMDPTQTLADMMQAILDEDRQTVIDRCDALSEWLDRGGFLPSLPEALGRMRSEVPRG